MSKMKQVSEEIKKALDEMPVHSQQLFHMFRKHKVQNLKFRNEIRAADREGLDMARSVGWKADGPRPEDIVGTPKGDRPLPRSYLDEDYIREHLARFDGGVTRFYNMDSLTRYGPGNDGTTFVLPTSEVEEMLRQADGDPRRLGELLGLGSDFFVDANGQPVDIVRADFSPEEVANLNLRMASGNEGFGEGGANSNWMPGGLLPGGNHEAVIHIDDMSQGGTYQEFLDFQGFKG